MKYDAASKTLSVSPRELVFYLPLLGLMFATGVAYAMTVAKIDRKADERDVKIVADSLGRQIAYQAGRLDRVEASTSTMALDVQAGLSILCENFPATQTRLSRLRCPSK